jgi:hypothetical protein
MSNESQTASNTPSDTVLCKMGCGFFVSRQQYEFGRSGVRTTAACHEESFRHGET